MNTIKTSYLQNALRILLGSLMILAAVGHFTFQRAEFQAQVPDWLPFGKDGIVLFSGAVELLLGMALIVWKKQRVKVGIALALFYLVIFPGNVAQYVNQKDAFGLNTDQARLIRLLFQPVLIIWALWATGAFAHLRKKYFT
jgi:uncharacterized membrane protein